MKKSVLVFSMVMILILSGFNMASGQQRPKSKKDTVNMDTDAKPTYYYPVEDDKKGKGSATTIAIIVGAVVIAGAAGFFLLKKKK